MSRKTPQQGPWPPVVTIIDRMRADEAARRPAPPVAVPTLETTKYRASVADELTKLVSLKESGPLTDDEFAELKGKAPRLLNDLRVVLSDRGR